MTKVFKKSIKLASEKGLIIKTMESCTGGAVASELTNVGGASKVIKESFVTYSNESKIAHGVPQVVIDTYSVYSKETAMAMAKACLSCGLKADIGIGVTGNFSNVDPANETASQPGVVYAAIIAKQMECVWEMTVPVEISRSAIKMHICEQISERLEKLLSET